MTRPAPTLFHASRRRAPAPAGFTLVELLVCVAIVSVLACIILVVSQQVRRVTNTARCAANLSGIGQAIALYVADNKGLLPPLFSGAQTYVRPIWINALLPYVDGSPPMPAPLVFPSIFYCPASDNHHPWGDYGANLYLFPNFDVGESVRLSSVASPANTLLAADVKQTGYDGSWQLVAQFCVGNPTYTASIVTSRHGNVFNGVFADGHVGLINSADFIANPARWLGTQYRGRQQP